jgi:5-methylcytosine-specific restriction endonuclease McrA
MTALAITHALVLNLDNSPKEIVTWRKALSLLQRGAATLVTGYDGISLRSESSAQPWPAVVRLNRYINVFGKVRFSRRNVLARDGYTCAYCSSKPRRGAKPDVGGLTLDHVVPKAQGVRGFVVTAKNQRVPVTSWQNVVAACWPCNLKKGARTPREAGMPLRFRARVPSPWDILCMSLMQAEIPTEWQEHLPKNSPWRGYWDDELLP